MYTKETINVNGRYLGVVVVDVNVHDTYLRARVANKTQMSAIKRIIFDTYYLKAIPIAEYFVIRGRISIYLESGFFSFGVCVFVCATCIYRHRYGYVGVYKQQ
uniref:Uncharacterized protein n=1 Tax=Glossina pallidipes TaxID=7398 RepID=A0A1B0AA16_GLOPL